jgi:hypothetical protein
MNTNTLTSAQLRKAATIRDRIDALEAQYARIISGSVAVAATETPKKKRKISAAGIAAIKAAQKKRWAKIKAAKKK